VPGAKPQRDPYGRLAWWDDIVMERVNGPLRGIGLRMHPPQPGMRVLDIGCGNGSLLALYADAGCSVAGVDTSPSMLARARRRLGERADIREASATSLPYADGSFDLVTASLMLHELTSADRAAAIAEMARVAAADGRLLITDFATGPKVGLRGHATRWFAVLAERLARHFDRSQAFLAEGAVPALATRHGLTVEKSKVVAGGNVGLYLMRPA
jgi:ubiquinone/menaquinone biosynthesis C-methylase UbiE